MEKISLIIDPESLTLGDLEDFEAYVGATVDEVMKPIPVFNDDGSRKLDERGRPESTLKIPSKALVCLAWLVNRKTNPGFTIADARNVPIGQLEIPADVEPADRGND